MPYAVELFFDATTDTAIRHIWRRLAAGDLAPYLHTSANRPHLTVALYERLALAEGSAALAAFAAEEQAFPICLASLGLFPPASAAVVFAAPVVTLPLLAIQARIHTILGSFAQGADERYVPGNWVPHCSLATQCPPARALDSLAVCLHLALPIHGRIAEIGVMQTSPARPQFAYVLRPAAL